MNFIKWIKGLFKLYKKISPKKSEKLLQFQKIKQRLQKRNKDGLKHTLQHLKLLLIYQEKGKEHYTKFLL